MDYFQILAVILLAGRIIAIKYLLRTAKKQIELLRLPIAAEVWDFRRKLHYMTVALLIGNIPPVVLDIVVIGGVDRTTPFLIVYAISNMTTMVIASIMIDRMYQLAANTKEVTDFESKQLKKK